MAIENIAPYWIRFPQTQEAKRRIKAEFMEKTNFPGTIGAIDCTHIAIIAPSQEEHNYLNRKGYHSKNVQIVSITAFEIYVGPSILYTLDLYVQPQNYQYKCSLCRCNS